MKRIAGLYLVVAWSAYTVVHADEYSDRLNRITRLIANEYDTKPGFLDPENMTSVALQAINFVTVENSISKNSPLGNKNKHIDTCAMQLKEKALELLKAIQDSEKATSQKTMRDAVLKRLWAIEMGLKTLEAEIDKINSKQLLPMTKVQKDLKNLLTLIAKKNLEITQRMIRNVEKL